jgi:hypothetical protein
VHAWAIKDHELLGIKVCLASIEADPATKLYISWNCLKQPPHKACLAFKSKLKGMHKINPEEAFPRKQTSVE